ncbi:uracil-DNA glycosylase [Jannaschia rubra]|uniref:Type-4 uracil-DNA glycosylase n=1 Tax=Jannaschia rubra TaxID=282197 RepID=A0A0M6XSQ8_9RHOB|nr:uracil-DNA glycosylase [Jannaschia rubra]CTQ33692.1 uracil-DNA glycosylase, family 4 [Jannaschia rubra]SFG06709.1 DNA polymerase [Jannaschia rubra]
MLDEMDPHAARAALEWLVEMGCDEAIGDHPVNRFALVERAAPPAAPPPLSLAPGDAPAPVDPVTEAETMAARAGTLEELRAALDAYPHCDLRRGAKSLVFSDGNPAARVMIIGEAPGREEDRAGRPFVGQAGQLLDRMLAAIGLARDHADPSRAVYITNILPWRPPSNRDPAPDEVAMMLPFLRRHVELANPDLLVLTGNHACNAVLGQRGITRLRGSWTDGFGRPALPLLHPAYLLRQPHAKRDTWADLLDLAARLEG